MGAFGKIDQQHPDDNSSDSSFSLGSDDNHSTIEDESTSSSESDEPVKALTNEPTTAIVKPSSSDRIYEVARVSYRDFSFGIFTDSQEEPLRFFFEPIVLLDPTTVSIKLDHISKQNNLVRFKIKMWTEDLRSKVLDRLRSLPDLPNSSKIQLDDISVMPYEDLKLVKESEYIINNKSVRLAQKSTSYERLNDSVPFYFRCDSMDSARFLADNLRQQPDFLLEKCKLGLECQGLGLPSGSNPPDRRRATFEVSTLPLKTIEGKYCNNHFM